MNRTVARAVTRRYSLALGLIAAVIVGGGWLLGDLVGRQERHATVINLAGAQRMLSQRIAALSSEVVAADQPAAGAMASLDAARDRIAAAHVVLTAGASAPARNSPELDRDYFADPAHLDGAVRSFLDRVDRFTGAVRANDAAEAAALGAELRAVALGPLLARLHHAVGLHEEAARRELQQVLWVHQGLVGAALLLLLAEASLIFWPLARRLGALAFHLEREASTDALTGLLNRHAFSSALQGMLAASARGGEAATGTEQVAVVIADLDWLKETNAAEGHAGGDALLRAAATAMRGALRSTDLVGRLGGDEFGAAFRVADRAAAQAAAERMCDALHRPADGRGRVLRSGASIGLAITPEDACDAEGLLRAAADAMVSAKRTQRGSVVAFGVRDRERLTREGVIRRALDRHDRDGLPGLCAHLQPQVRMADGALVGLEALARWRHPLLGQLSPAEFLPLAQEHGCMDIVGGHVRRSALAAITGLWAAGHPWGPPPRLALNLSHAELARGDAVSAVEADLRAAGLPPTALEIEITEEVLLDRVSESTRAQLVGLRERGARLALDDFGTGGAGLSQVLRLPLDALKVDRSFVRELGRDTRAAEVVRATVILAHGLGLEIVAEGVETPDQLARLRSLGCDVTQGYLHAPALAPQELASWLRAHVAPRTEASTPGIDPTGGSVVSLRRRLG